MQPLGVQPDVVGRAAADKPVVLQVAAPRVDGKAACLVGAEGDLGLFLRAPRLRLLREFDEPRRDELLLKCLQIVRAVRGGEQRREALQVGEFAAHFRLLRCERLQRALLLLVALEVRLRVLRGGEPLVQRDLDCSALFVIVVDELARLHAPRQRPQVGGDQLALLTDALRVGGGALFFQNLCKPLFLLFDRLTDGGRQPAPRALQHVFAPLFGVKIALRLGERRKLGRVFRHTCMEIDDRAAALDDAWLHLVREDEVVHMRREIAA